MGKLIFWFVIGLVILTVARIAARAGARGAQHQAREQARGQGSGRGNGGNGGAGRPGRPAAVQHAEQMVRCAHCGIHLPRSEAVLSAGETYCGQEHARLGVARQR